MSEDRAVNCPTCSTKCTIVKFCGCKESGCDGDPHYVINESYYRKKFAMEFLEKIKINAFYCGDNNFGHSLVTLCDIEKVLG